MNKINDFRQNERESKRYRHLMHHFYDLVTPGCRVEYYDASGGFSEIAQRYLKIDGAYTSPSGWVESFEEKLASWPKNGKPHRALYAETDSCTLAGFHSHGWMHESMADKLTYMYELPFGLYIYFLPFRNGFKPWFWDNLSDKRHRWTEHENGEQNKTKGRLVPLSDIQKAFPDEKQYLLLFNGTCKEATSGMEECVKRHNEKQIITEQITKKITAIKQMTVGNDWEREEDDPFEYKRGREEVERIFEERKQHFWKDF